MSLRKHNPIRKMKTPKFALKALCCTLLMLPIMASCSKDDDEKQNPEIPSSSQDSYVLDLEDISGGNFNGTMYLPAAGTAYYSDGTWGNNPHATGAEIIGMIGYVDDAIVAGTHAGIVISLKDIESGQYYKWSVANGLAASYATAGTSAGDWYVANSNQWVSVINALFSSSYTPTKEVWQGGAKLYATINKRLADVGGVQLNGGYWSSSSDSELIIFNVRDGFYIDNDPENPTAVPENQRMPYLEAIRPFMNVALMY